MVEINRLTTTANMHWRFVDRTAGAAAAAIDWRFTVGDRVKIRLVNEMDSDHPMHHPFHLHGAGRFLVLARDGAPEPQPGLEGHRPGPHRADRRHLVRRHQPRPVDGSLPYRRTHAERHDVQLHRGPGSGTMTGANTIEDSGLTRDTRFDVIVIGGGQAGLAMAWHLAQRRLRFVVLEAADRARATPGGPGGTRCGCSLPAQYDALPGMAFPAPADTYPGKEAVADFLRDYADRVRPSGATGQARHRAQPDRTTSSKSAPASRSSTPSRWSWPPARSRSLHAAGRPAGFDGSVTQIHSADYRNPQSLPAGPGPGCWWRELRTADRRRTRRDPTGGRVSRREGADAAAAPARPRPVLVAHPTRLHAREHRNPARQARAGPRRIRHRHQPPTAQAGPASASVPA